MVQVADRRTVMRDFVLAAASLYASGHMKPALAQTPKRVRFGAHTAEGKKMLAIYADGVRAMMDPKLYKENDPRSWMFQWYTHSVRGDRTKESEIKRVFKGDAAGAIAQGMWDTCEAHFDSARENFFLPWHRLYVQFFEDIVRQVTGNPKFTLPYWDYTTPANRALPAEFLKPGDAKWGPLYRASRNQHAKDGKPIDAGPPGSEVSLRAMRSATYGDDGADAGFCANLDGGLHGAVHVNIGNGTGMGSVEWAAGDPIFWLHHCNIDRVWASWIKAGGTNPNDAAFLSEAFNFADGAGKAAKGKVGDVLPLGDLAYDTYLDRPANSLPFPKPGPQLVAKGLRFQSTERVKLGAKDVTVRLGSPTVSPGEGPLPVASTGIKDVPSEATVHLRLEGLSVSRPVAVSYDVHVVGGPAGKASRASPSYVGSVNFFGASHAHAGHGATSSQRTVSFPIGNEARKLLAAQSGPIQIKLVPSAENAPVEPVIERISVVTR